MLNKIWNWVRVDGLLHIEACVAIVLLVGRFLPWWAACIAGAVAGIAKEIWDIKHGTPDWHDLVCDLIGIVIGVIPLFF